MYNVVGFNGHQTVAKKKGGRELLTCWEDFDEPMWVPINSMKRLWRPLVEEYTNNHEDFLKPKHVAKKCQLTDLHWWWGTLEYCSLTSVMFWCIVNLVYYQNVMCPLLCITMTNPLVTPIILGMCVHFYPHSRIIATMLTDSSSCISVLPSGVWPQENI